MKTTIKARYPHSTNPIQKICPKCGSKLICKNGGERKRWDKRSHKPKPPIYKCLACGANFDLPRQIGITKS